MKKKFRILFATILALAIMLSSIPVFAASYATGTYKPSEWDGLNIRSGASTSYSIVGRIAAGTTFTVTKVSGIWGYTTCNGRTGWVCLDYATYVGSTNSTTSAASSGKIVSRDDGTWLFPVDKKYYNLFSDWCGCPGHDACIFCGVRHYNWEDNVEFKGHCGQMGHNGLDLAVVAGTPVYASASGTYYTGGSTSHDRGYYIVIEHNIGNGVSYYSGYQHLSKFNSSLKDGQSVKAGDLIGYSGSTGAGSGTHLHFGIVIGKSGYGLGGLEAFELWNSSNPWATSSSATQGRILNNPADNLPTSTQGCSKGALEAHKGSVHYTFDKSKVSIGNGNVVAVSDYYLDVNGYVNGEEKKSLNGYVTFDVYINGSCVKSNVGDFCTQYPDGTAYEIKNIKAASGYEYASGSSLVGKINGAHTYPILNIVSQKAETSQTTSSVSSKIDVPEVKYVTEEAKNSTSSVPSGYYESIPYGQSAENYTPIMLYRYRDKSETTEYGNWSEAKYTSSTVTESDTVSVISSQKYYNYYHYCSQTYGGVSNNVDSIKYGSGGIYHTKKTTTEMTKSNIADKGGKTLYGGENSNKCEKGQRVWAQADPFITYEYTYKTRTKTVKTVCTAWSDWQTAEPNANNRDVANQMFFKYQPKTYTVSYNAGGGTNAPQSQTKVHGETVKLSAQVPTRNGYTFAGWATSANGNVSYKAGGSYTPDANITLYAIWNANTYTVSYNTTGGTNAPQSQTKVHGESIRLSTQEPTKTDCIFLGWSRTVDGDAEFASGSVYSSDETVTLYAVWQEKENEVYYVIYNSNGGSQAPSMQTKNQDETVTISDMVPVRDGYVFEGWASGNEAVATYFPNDTYGENKTLYLRAVWTAKTYTVSYHANGGSGAPTEQIKTHDVPITISRTNPMKENHTFVGWSDDPYAKAAKYFAGESFYENTDTVLYAVWEEITEEPETKNEEREEFGEDKTQNEKEMPFEDIPEDAWYKNDVENAYKNGLIKGKSEKRYAPGDNMTYAEAIKLACTIYQLYYDGTVTITNGTDRWYSTYMDYALENRIVRKDYTSVANEYVTRKEFVNIFYGALPLKEFVPINQVENDSIPDVKQGDAYATEIYTFYKAGILTGNDATGTFKPDSSIRRNEVAAIVTRMLDSGARRKTNF